MVLFQVRRYVGQLGNSLIPLNNGLPDMILPHGGSRIYYL